MKTHKVKITETYAYEIDVEAPSQREVIEKAKYKYKNEPDGYVGVADGNSYVGAKFKVVKNN